MLHPCSAAAPGPQIPRCRPSLRARARHPIGARDDLALEIGIADLRGDIERKRILIDALLACLSTIEAAALVLSFELPRAAGVELFADVIDGMADVAAYRLALIRLDLDDAVIERAVADLANEPPAVLMTTSFPYVAVFRTSIDVDLSTAAE